MFEFKSSRSEAIGIAIAGAIFFVLVAWFATTLQKSIIADGVRRGIVEAYKEIEGQKK